VFICFFRKSVFLRHIFLMDSTTTFLCNFYKISAMNVGFSKTLLKMVWFSSHLEDLLDKESVCNFHPKYNINYYFYHYYYTFLYFIYLRFILYDFNVCWKNKSISQNFAFHLYHNNNIPLAY
jgi:hypothetical protein